VNLSLLNLPWYREMLRTGPHRVPVPTLGNDVKGIPSHAALTGLLANLEQRGWKRPIYASVTVAFRQYPIPNTRSLEGLTYRLLRSKSDDETITRDRLEDNLEQQYRLDSASSLAVNWDDWSALRPIVLNYAVAEACLAGALAKSGEVKRARNLMNRSLDLCVFHDDARLGRYLVTEWKEWDGRSSDWRQWNRRFRE